MVLNNDSTREREIKLLPQTHSPEVDYSLFIMETVMMMLERMEIQPGMAPVAFFPPIFAGSGSVLVFLCFCSAPSEIALGNLFIGIFRSRLGVRVEGGWLRALEEETSMGGVATPWPAPPGHFWASGLR